MNQAAMLMVLLAAVGQSSDRTAPEDRGGVNSGQGAPSHVDDAAKSFDRLRQAAARYRIVLQTDTPRELAIAPEPVLRWTNPLRRTSAGATFVWVGDGRPEVVGSFFRYTEDGKTVEDDEFQSLATTGLTASRSDQPVWAPRAAGMELAPIPGAPKPAATASERLRQMHAMASEFHAFIDTDKDKSELRLLPKPLYRYRTNRPDLPDGALFTFVLTTDPEVLLAIEARPIHGTAVWHYGFARMSMINLRQTQRSRCLASRLGCGLSKPDRALCDPPCNRSRRLNPTRVGAGRPWCVKLGEATVVPGSREETKRGSPSLPG